VLVKFTSSRPGKAQVPATVTIPAGSNSAPFEITTAVVRVKTTVTIKATYAGLRKKTTLTIRKPQS
jgi:hypothetical protein